MASLVMTIDSSSDQSDIEQKDKKLLKKHNKK